MDSMSQTLYFNGSLKDTMTATSAGIENPTLGFQNSNTSFTRTFQFNFGQRSWTHEPPSGYKALCTNNLPDPLVNPKEHFGATTWTGDGTASRTIDTGIDAGLVWTKERVGVQSHQLYDTVRGLGPKKALTSNATISEAGGNGDEHGYISDIASNGFTATSGFTDNSYQNKSGSTYVAWNFRGGDTVTNNDGSIQSEVSANKDMGFSVVKYTGNYTEYATVGHGLGVPPKMMIFKSINGDLRNWAVFAEPMGWNQQMYLNSYLSAEGSPGLANLPPNATTITLGGGYPGAGETNSAGEDYIAYCFTNTEMLQVGSYWGNATVDGPFISLPFKPAYFLVKLMNYEIANWAVYDNARDIDNIVGQELNPDDSRDETFHPDLDFLSNGIKLRNGRTINNNAGHNYLYLAIAEQPFKQSRGR
jgi:hypothetical protein